MRDWKRLIETSKAKDGGTLGRPVSPLFLQAHGYQALTIDSPSRVVLLWGGPQLAYLFFTQLASIESWSYARTLLAISRVTVKAHSNAVRHSGGGKRSKAKLCHCVTQL